MAAALARLVLVGAGIAVLAASFVEARWAIWAAVLGIALFPSALMSLARPRRSRVEPWVLLLALSLTGGLAVSVGWHDSPSLAGVPVATWLAWVLLAGVPFVLVVIGLATHEPGT